MAGSAGKNAATLIAACLAGPLVAHAQLAVWSPKQASAPAERRWTDAYGPVPWLPIGDKLLLRFARDAESTGPGAPRVLGSANATVRMSRDWDAAVGVSYLDRRDGIDERATQSGAALVNGELVRWFGRTTRISFHVFNALNHRVEPVDAFDAVRLGWLEGTGETFLATPTEPRAFLVKFRTRF